MTTHEVSYLICGIVIGILAVCATVLVLNTIANRSIDNKLKNLVAAYNKGNFPKSSCHYEDNLFHVYLSTDGIAAKRMSIITDYRVKYYIIQSLENNFSVLYDVIEMLRKIEPAANRRV